MSNETVPIKEGLFKVKPDGKACLIIGKCDECSTPAFPYQPYCLNCGSDQMKEVEVSKGGKLRNFTSVLHPSPESKMTPPYGMAIVEFPEEQIRIAGVTTEPDYTKLKSGMDVNVIVDKMYEEDGKDVLSFRFQIKED